MSLLILCVLKLLTFLSNAFYEYTTNKQTTRSPKKYAQPIFLILTVPLRYLFGKYVIQTKVKPLIGTS